MPEREIYRSENEILSNVICISYEKHELWE